jgi:hypothetical protein
MLARQNLVPFSISLWLALFALTASGQASAYSGTITCNGTDVTAALNAALASSVTDGSGQITFTAGTCVISSAISRTMTGMHGLQLQGAGLEATTLQFTNGGGFSFTAGFYTSGINFTAVLTLKDLSIVTTGATNVDTCINIDGQAATSASAFSGTSSALLQNVYCRNSGASAWSQGVHVVSLGSIDLINFNYFGAPTTGTKAGTGINIENHLTCCEATQYNVIGGRVYWAATAILVTGKIQGLIVNNFNAAAVTYGLYWSTDYPEPQCSIGNSQIAADSVGVFATNCTASSINNNLIYPLVGGSGILINNTGDTAITGNSVQGTTSSNNIVIQGSSQHNIICNNTIGVASTGVWLQSGTSNNTVCNNFVRSFSAFNYLNQGVTSGPTMNVLSGNR